jgi:hypothetical protein
LNGFETDPTQNADQGQKHQKSGQQGNVTSINSTDGTDSTIDDDRREEEEGGLMNNSGLLPSNSLSCLASTVAESTDKKRPLGNSNKIIPSIKVSFKRNSGKGHNKCKCQRL